MKLINYTLRVAKPFLLRLKLSCSLWHGKHEEHSFEIWFEVKFERLRDLELYLKQISNVPDENKTHV